MKKMKSDIVQPAEPEKDYETEGHLKTILDAHAIMQDHGKMKKVHKLAGRHKKAITSLDDLKAYAQEKYGPQKKAVDNDMDNDGE